VSERVFGLLLYCFPPGFRRRFGTEMRALFRDQLRDARTGRAPVPVVRFWFHLAPSLVGAVLLEWRDVVLERLVSSPIAPPPFIPRERMLHSLTSDVRLAIRMLRKNPVFTLIAVLVIAIGSGAVTTIFSAMNAIVLRPLPGTHGTERLVDIERRSADYSEGTTASYDYFTQLRERTRTLDGIAAWTKVSLTLADRGQGNAVYGNMVSGNYFSLLGVRPALGRFFAPDEDRTPLTHPVVVVSHGFWQSALGSDSGAIGRAVTVNGNPYTLIGVAPAGFRGVFSPLRVDAWVPLMMQQQLRSTRDLEDAAWLRTFGRLAPGTSVDQARQELTALTVAYIADRGERGGNRDYNTIRLSALTGLPADAREGFLGFMQLLLGAAALVLLIASVNVASMLSARAIARQREMAVRVALGAGRARLVRQLLTETMMLFTLGAIGGMGVATMATAALEQVPIPTDAAIVLELSPDPRVLAFALAISLATGLIFGLSPALQASRKDVTAQLREGSTGSGTRRRLMSHALIVGQLAMSLVLLVGAGLFLRALQGGQKVNPGFQIAGVASVAFNTEAFGYDAVRGRAFYEALRESVRSIPGVEAVSFTDRLPLALSSSGATIDVDDAVNGAVDREGKVSVQLSQVDAGFFDVLQLPIRSGRAISSTDNAESPRVAVINETMARRLWPLGTAIGRSFRFGPERVTVVGVAQDAKYDHLAEATPSYVYFASAQNSRPDQWLVVRSAGDAAALAAAIERAVRAIDPLLPRPVVMTLTQTTSISLLPQRVAALVTGVLGAVGLLLATVGLYGLIAYSANRRTREIGIRVALGATRSDVLALVVREGMWLAGLGVVIGVVLAGAASQLLRSLLFDTSPLDVPTYAVMSLLFIAVAMLASYLPARRAASANPATALRSD